MTSQTDSILVELNGQPHRFEGTPSIDAAMVALGLDGRRVAAMLNGDIVPRARYGETVLAEGDKLELITLVGGG